VTDNPSYLGNYVTADNNPSSAVLVTLHIRSLHILDLMAVAQALLRTASNEVVAWDRDP
jgi:hypothetical protein